MLAVLGLALPALITGCAAGSSGRLDRSGQVWREFMSGQVLEGYTYYTTGMENMPDAILAIAPGYTLKTDRWLEREMTPPALRQLVGEMNALYVATAPGLLGCYVLNDKGERIGVWYSALGYTTVKMTGATEVRVNPPSAPQIDILLGGSKK
jgi:hypothetical protein